jgi:hypothetical protein
LPRGVVAQPGKAGGRENANFAIPVGAVAGFLEGIRQPESAAGNGQAEARTRKLIAAGDDAGYKTILPLISESYIVSLSVSTFLEMFAGMDKEAKADAVRELRRAEPFSAFRIVIADAVHRKLRKAGATFTGVQDGSGGLVTGISVKGKETELEWADESGTLYLVNTPMLKETGSGKVYTRMWDKVDRALIVGAGFSLDSREKAAWSFTFERRHSQYFASFFELTSGRKVGQIEVLDENSEWQPEPKSFGYFGMSYGVQIQYPVKFCPVHTIPFVRIPVGISLGSDASDLHYGIRPGIRFAMQLGDKAQFLFVDAEYRYKKIPEFGDAHDHGLPKSTSMFGLSLGYAF